jgi:hypothetical protein
VNKKEITTEDLGKAIFTINKHAKTALEPKALYWLKKKTIEKLLKEGKAKKVGLHYSPNPKNCRQQSDVLISIGDYFFHIPPSKEDHKQLPHLGNRDGSYRNKKSDFSLKKSKEILEFYLDEKKITKEPKREMKQKKRGINNINNNIFTNSYLGKI